MKKIKAYINIKNKNTHETILSYEEEIKTNNDLKKKETIKVDKIKNK